MSELFLLQNQIDLNHYTMMDIDGYSNSFVKHLKKNHLDFWYKRSTNNGVHALVQNPCKRCQNYNDPFFDGKLLFINKSQKYSPIEWRNLKNERNVFPMKVLYNIRSRKYAYRIIENSDMIITHEHLMIPKFPYKVALHLVVTKLRGVSQEFRQRVHSLMTTRDKKKKEKDQKIDFVTVRNIRELKKYRHIFFNGDI